ELADKELLTRILANFEEFEKITEKENHSDESLAKLISRFIELFKALILEDVDDIPAALKTVNEGITALKDIFENKTTDKNIGDKVKKIVNNINKLLKIEEEDDKELKDNKEKQQKSEPEVITVENEEDFEIYAGFISESNEHIDTIEEKVLDLENNPKDMDAINAVFRAFHSMKGAAGFLGLTEIGDFCHEIETLLDKARKGEIFITPEITDIVFKSIDVSRKMIDNLSIMLENTKLSEKEKRPVSGVDTSHILKEIRNIISSEKAVSSGEEGEKIGEILLNKGKISPEDLERALELQSKPIGELLVDIGATSPDEVEKAVKQQKEKGKIISSQIKVDTSKLDLLLEMIGEMVIAQSQISQDEHIRLNGNQNLLKKISNMDKITRRVQEHIMSLRMVPLKQLFHKMMRLVRDLSRQTKKDVNFIVSGEETEIDKTIIDKLNDPLVHLLRNAVDHGIENKETRKKSNKPLKGTIELKAYHKEGNVVIEIKDDGKGISKEKVKQKAIKKGLISEDAELTDKQIFDLIFLPGFSTNEKATSISGRGVGMDVVKKNIENLNGKVEIFSEEGKRTTISLKLPLTMAIIEGIIVRIGKERYIIPTISIREAIHPEKDQITTIRGKNELINVRGNQIPVIRLSKIFNINPEKNDPWDALIVIVENEGKKKGLMVDEILGQQQVVIKSLGEKLKNINFISGGAILGDGNICLILDIAGIMELNGKY
ncbi:chemotaxis protein CheA, partial [candidate division KSB1 bacterium]